MKTSVPLCFVFVLVLAGASASALRAQSEQLVLDPPLSQIFPLEVKPDGVRVQYPVLLNDHTIVRPDAVLRFIYIDANAGMRGHKEEDGGGDFRTHVGSHGTVSQDDPGTHAGAGAGSGGAGAWGANDTDDTGGLFDKFKKTDAKTSKSELQNEIWKQKDLYAEALDHASDMGTTVVYSVPPQKKALTAAFDLPEGLLLAEVDGHVRVLGLVQESRAFTAGIRAGDEIRSISGGAPLATLDDFIRDYMTTKHQAKVTGNPTYAMEIWRPSQQQTVSIQIAAPPTIPKFF